MKSEQAWWSRKEKLKDDREARAASTATHKFS